MSTFVSIIRSNELSSAVVMGTVYRKCQQVITEIFNALKAVTTNPAAICTKAPASSH